MRCRSPFQYLPYVVALLAFAVPSFAQVGISVSFGPPALPVYEQPVCPSEGYMWVPGYWAWDADYDDYYWVPGTWVLAPEPGLLWTPPYWAWDNGAYLFHEGYWAPQVGFYGGIVYGFGYFGVGFEGGRWQGNQFFYNRAVTDVNVVNIRNVYHETVNVNIENRVSYNGGPGGIQARPRPQDEAIARGRRLPPVSAQTQHSRDARSNRELRASDNHGRPPIAATARAGEFRNATPARAAGAPYNPPANRGHGPSGSENAGSHPAVHPRDLPPIQRPPAPNTGQSSLDRKYQQQQDKMYAKQQQERQQLQQKQEQQDQRLERQNADQSRKQQTEQRHQQQTEQLQQRHVQEQQRMQERQQPPHKK